MVRQQINIKLPPELIEALREKASTEEVTLTELIQGYCEQGLGMPPSNHQPVDTALIYERILTEVGNRIVTQLDIRIPELEEPLLSQLEERIAFVVDARISSQVALLEQRMATQLGERAQQQSPFPDELALPLDKSAIVEDARAVNPLEVEAMALGDIGEVENASVGNMLEDIPALVAPSRKPVEESKLVTPAPKSQREKSGKKQHGEVLARVEENLIRGKQLSADELAPLIGVSAQAIRDRRNAEKQGKAGKLAEWGLRFVPDSSNPELFERI